MQGKNLRRQLEGLAPGDLVCVDWCDASVGKSLGSGVAVDVPVKSWGVFIGVLGEKNKHIVVAQNTFRYSDGGLFDIDFTAVPLSCTANITIIAKGYIEPDTAVNLVNSFLMGGRRIAHERKIHQQSVKNHG